MRQYIQKDIEMLNYLYNTINKSVFICINCNNFDILYYYSNIILLLLFLQNYY